MKKSIKKITGKALGLLLILKLGVGCSCNDNEDSHQSFCKIERVYYADVNDKNGTLIYLDEKDKYAIRYYPSSPTIDEVYYYVLCEKPKNINVDDTVKFSVKLYKFNNKEGYAPAVGGLEYYYANLVNIAKL
ncbi:MAG: hypothetical protein QM564_05215 [Bergeyella sp.]